MKKEEKKKYKYTWRSIRIINGDEFEKFRQLCKESYTTTNREFNVFIHKCVQAGKIIGTE